MSSLTYSTSACTIFSASNDVSVLVGNNEDWYHNNFSISFYPANSYRQYGYCAFTHSEDYNDIRAGMNDQGVFIDSAYVRPSNVTIDPAKPFFNRNFFRIILDSCSSVNETLDLFSQYNSAETWDWQILVADSHGDSVVIVAGPDESVHYIRKNETYQLITNGNIAYPELGESSSSALRYYVANNLLGVMGDNITVDYFRQVLDAAHQDGTAFSSVYDLVTHDIYIYYNHDYSTEIIINLDDALTQGSHTLELFDLHQYATICNLTPAEAPTTSSIGPRFDLFLSIGLSFSIVLVSVIVVSVVTRRNQ
jgi:hypothetical protein